jgi:hypothetical protein
MDDRCVNCDRVNCRLEAARAAAKPMWDETDASSKNNWTPRRERTAEDNALDYEFVKAANECNGHFVVWRNRAKDAEKLLHTFSIARSRQAVESLQVEVAKYLESLNDPTG